MEPTLKEVYIEIEVMKKLLLTLRKVLFSLKEDMDDRFLTPEEEIALEESLEDYKKGNTISLEDLKKQINV